MTIDPDTLRAERFVEIGHLLKQEAGMLLDRWCQRAREEQLGVPRVHQDVLRDRLLNLLQALAQGLATSHESEKTPQQLIALEHGEQRWEAGWSLAEVIQDYQLLRLVVVDYLDEALDRSLSAREVMAIGLAVDEAIAASVTMYTKYRDHSIHQAEHERLMTEKQAAELARRHAEALQVAKRRTDEFLSVLAHELRNPLSPIVYTIEASRLAGSTDPLVIQTWDIIDRQVQQITRLVDDLLDVTRVNQGKMELRTERVNIADVVNQSAVTCTPLIESRRQQLSVTLPGEPLLVDADPARIVQIVCNLVNNAAKYSEPGRRIWLSARAEAEQAVIVVRDEGNGIAPEMLPQIFDMYWQVPRPGQSPDGLGIGLALVRSLAEMHGGSVTADSRGVGQGSEFVVRLPLAART